MKNTSKYDILIKNHTNIVICWFFTFLWTVRIFEMGQIYTKNWHLSENVNRKIYTSLKKKKEIWYKVTFLFYSKLFAKLQTPFYWKNISILKSSTATFLSKTLASSRSSRRDLDHVESIFLIHSSVENFLKIFNLGDRSSLAT